MEWRLAFKKARQAAGVVSVYDTTNGMLLEASLHTTFDSYLWCMDEFCLVRVSERVKADDELREYEGKRINLVVSDRRFPSRELLRARFELYRKMQSKKRSTKAPPRKYHAHTV